MIANILPNRTWYEDLVFGCLCADFVDDQGLSHVSFWYLGLDACTGTLRTGKAYLMLPSQRRYVGCDIGKECVGSVRSSVELVFGRQAHNRKSDIYAPNGVESACWAYVGSVDTKITRFWGSNGMLRRVCL